MNPVVKICVAGLICMLPAGVSNAGPLVGEKNIFLLNQSGDKIHVGTIDFAPGGDGTAYTLVLNDAPFADHFLSMRPFKCLEGSEKHWCHVPYPYRNDHQVREDDLTDLEYDLLFLWKGATDYGINMWNGVYYQLRIEGDTIAGTLHEMDMDILSAPPEDGTIRTIGPTDLHEADAASHWLPRLLIE